MQSHRRLSCTPALSTVPPQIVIHPCAQCGLALDCHAPLCSVWSSLKLSCTPVLCVVQSQIVMHRCAQCSPASDCHAPLRAVQSSHRLSCTPALSAVQLQFVIHPCFLMLLRSYHLHVISSYHKSGWNIVHSFVVCVLVDELILSVCMPLHCAEKKHSNASL